MARQGRALTPLLLHPKIDGVARDAHPPSGGCLLAFGSPCTKIIHNAALKLPHHLKLIPYLLH